MATSGIRRPIGDQLLSLRRESRGSDVIVRVGGELDLTSHLELRQELFEVGGLLDPPARLIVDLTEVGFLASVGLTELLMAHERLSSRRIPLRVVANHRRILRPIELTGLDRKLDLYPSVEEALRADG